MDPAEFPRHCGCGCGAPINELLDAILEHRRFGLTYPQIAKRLGVSVSRVSMASRQVAQFVKGHGARASSWETRICTECGGEFRIRAAAPRSYCNRRGCVSSSLSYYKKYGGPQRVCYEVARSNQRLRENHAQTIGRIYSESQEARALARRAIEAGYTPGPDIPTLEEQLAAADAEVRALYAEQLQDARREQVQHGPSLDRRADESDDGSWYASRYGAVHFDREDDIGPYRAAQGVGRKVRACS